MKIKQAIGRLKKLKARMERPEDFYRAHRTGWDDLARQTVVQVLLANRPPDVDADDWAQTAAQAARLVALQVLALDGVGVSIFLEVRHNRDLWGAAIDGGLTLEDIASYVAAGRAGDPLGKPDFTPEDALKTDEQVALNILEAIRKRRTDRDLEIERFLEERMGDRLGMMLPLILATWREVFAVRAGVDWRRWWRRAFK